MTGCIIVFTRDRPFYSIKTPKPNVSNRIADYLARSPKIALTPSSFCNLPKITRSTILPSSSPRRTGSQKPGFFRDALLQPDSLAKTRFLWF
ncbi:MAG: hypothetical protein EAZ39_24980 [Oscillatoriales cyanobacterium]|uniref:hypothetical protein n=1 Tax=Microcoleus sp. PH2017_05_CCC_O_A TaxID=2798816 RepID=UPI001D820386|nr:hypothetical protein [Microcoleus sp. PH2017_05_CCC_O_A]MCC3434755.1 hypothetical protein [Microcoleus sp. PH2017_05_CCC_O_A]TAG14317.1 MAG: hypothetical protein EAZ39_24980 [Oscillatoriales cyanobacterium]TAG47226.1 MAG: hypothetical protein EAZ33_05055 [Oscillatoriales cyanobacterium]